MPLVSMREMLDHAAENLYGIPAFNVAERRQTIRIPLGRRFSGFVLMQAGTPAFQSVDLVRPEFTHVTESLSSS